MINVFILKDFTTGDKTFLMRLSSTSTFVTITRKQKKKNDTACGIQIINFQIINNTPTNLSFNIYIPSDKYNSSRRRRRVQQDSVSGEKQTIHSKFFYCVYN